MTTKITATALLIVAMAVAVSVSAAQSTKYHDGRPTAELRLDAKDLCPVRLFDLV